jgi:hypothetical protein
MFRFKVSARAVGVMSSDVSRLASASGKGFQYVAAKPSLTSKLIGMQWNPSCFDALPESSNASDAIRQEK